jgi:Cu/Ag efflux protein CusF
MKQAVLSIAAAFLLGAAPALVAQAPALADGEVRRVDKEARKLTIKHGPIVHLDMPAMTMVFQVKDPAMLDQLKAGDRVRFAADKIDGAYTVTRIEK